MSTFQIHRGFTLIEMLVTIAVLAIVLAIAAPSFSTIVKNSRLATETNDLMSDLALARTEAARRGRRVSLCISNNGTTCATSGSDWSGGRIIFSDVSPYGQIDSGDTILRVVPSASTKKITLTASGFSELRYLQFRPNGASSSSTTGVIKICDDRAGSFGREIEILITGRVSLKTTTSSCS
ncbi:GspH/FimT family pseudopilin [Propionivibrio limicola]|uniref:GspH/FimT family pseudopilin n=1 Tax=Propionivibrio limicola TaxID=167645 RepID=UPI001291B76C|nr:GspH/FimT family pseudopilin [Propionivibrio limicola]